MPGFGAEPGAPAGRAVIAGCPFDVSPWGWALAVVLGGMVGGEGLAASDAAVLGVLEGAAPPAAGSALIAVAGAAALGKPGAAVVPERPVPFGCCEGSRGAGAEPVPIEASPRALHVAGSTESVVLPNNSQVAAANPESASPPSSRRARHFAAAASGSDKPMFFVVLGMDGAVRSPGPSGAAAAGAQGSMSIFGAGKIRVGDEVSTVVPVLMAFSDLAAGPATAAAGSALAAAGGPATTAGARP